MIAKRLILGRALSQVYTIKKNLETLQSDSYIHTYGPQAPHTTKNKKQQKNSTNVTTLFMTKRQSKLMNGTIGL